MSDTPSIGLTALSLNRFPVLQLLQASGKIQFSSLTLTASGTYGSLKVWLLLDVDLPGVVKAIEFTDANVRVSIGKEFYGVLIEVGEKR